MDKRAVKADDLFARSLEEHLVDYVVKKGMVRSLHTIEARAVRCPHLRLKRPKVSARMPCTDLLRYKQTIGACGFARDNDLTEYECTFSVTL